MIGPVILPLDDAVAVLASASAHEQVSGGSARNNVQKHVYAFNMVRTASGGLIAGHASHASHASHSSHVSSAGSGGGSDDSGDSTSPVYTAPIYTAPAAPTSVSATPGDGSATVSWSPVSSDDGGQVTYVVTANPGGISTTVVGVTTATLQGLTDGTPYSFTVVASNTVGSGPASVASGTVTPLAPQLIGHRPVIVGQAVAQHKLVAETPGWAVGTTFAYQWSADGEPISGATNLTFSPSSSLAGKRLQVSVTGENPGYAKGATVSSVKTHRVAIASVPKIVGSPKVGATLRAHPGTWITGTEFAYAWFVGGRKVPHDSGSALLVQSKYVGKSVTVKVTGSKSGFDKVTLTSVATGEVHR